MTIINYLKEATMKKEIRQVPVYKQIQMSTVDKEVFITNDGKSFDTEDAALKHEAEQLSKANFETKYFLTTTEIDGTFYEVIFLKDLSKETLIEVCAKNRRMLRSDLRIGINLIHTDSSGDYDSVTVEHPEALILSYESAVAELKTVIEKYRNLVSEAQESL
jgi:hypothetical protein